MSIQQNNHITWSVKPPSPPKRILASHSMNDVFFKELNVPVSERNIPDLLIRKKCGIINYQNLKFWRIPMKSDNRIKKFFEGVEQASNTLDLNLIDVQFADQFIFADPNGTRVVEKQEFLAFLPQRQECFKSIGHQSTKVLSLDETKLDDQYTMVNAHFLMQFKKASGQIVEAKVDSTYFLFMKGETPKIIMHMEHEDVREAMKT